jgi:hypothetical protein
MSRGVVGPDVSVAGVGEQNVGANVGAGDADVYRDKTGVTLNFRTLSGGTGITVTENVDVIEIALSGAIGESNDGANVGGGDANIFRDKTGVDLNFKTLVEGTNVSLTDGADTITIAVPSAAPSGVASGMLSGTYPSPDVDNFSIPGQAVGSLAYLLASQWTALIPGTAGQLLTTQGAGVAPTWTTVTPGETNVGANVGGNPGELYRDKTGSTLNFRTIGAGPNVSVATVGNSVTIGVSDAPPSGAAGGDLDGFYPNPVVSDLTMFGEAQGAVLYFDGVNWVVLSPGTLGQGLITQGAGANPQWGNVGDIVGAANIGTGTGNVFSSKNGVNLEFRSLEGLNGIAVTTSGDNVRIDGSSLIADGDSAGGDLGGTYPDPTVVDFTITDQERGSVLYFDGSNWVHLAPGDADDILKSGGTGADPYWSAIGASGENNIGVNVGVGLPIYRDKTGVSLNFRSVVAGTNVSIVNLGDELRFAVAGAEPIGAAGGELAGTYPDPTFANIYFDGTLRNAFGGNNAGNGASTTGADNALWGVSAGSSLIGGIQNAAGGSEALAAAISSSSSSAWGFRALRKSTQGSNTAIGAFAGSELELGTGNTFLGDAGIALDNGSDNLLGGFGAAGNLTEGDRNIVFGIGTQVPNSTGSDQLVIGLTTGLIFGNLASGLLAVGGTTIPTGSAELDLRSTDKATLISRGTTAQKLAVADPVDAMLFYDTDNGRLEHYFSGIWEAVGGISSATIGGTIDDAVSGTLHQVAYANELDTIQGSNGFTYQDALKEFTIGLSASEYYSRVKGGTEASLNLGNSDASRLLISVSGSGRSIVATGGNLSIAGATTERVLVNTVDIRTDAGVGNYLDGSGNYSTPPDTGEVNTASNQGTGPGEIFWNKSGVDLRFNNLKSETDLLTIDTDVVTHDVEFTINESLIDHTQIDNIGTNSHADIDTHIGIAVTSTDVLTDNYILRGDGGDRGAQTSLVEINDLGDIISPNTVRGNYFTAVETTSGPAAFTFYTAYSSLDEKFWRHTQLNTPKRYVYSASRCYEVYAQW